MSRKPSLLAAAIKQVEPQTAESSSATPADTQEHAGRRGRPAGGEQVGSYIAPSRANKTAKTHYLPPAYWETLAELSFRSRDAQGKRIPQERFVAEALNLLFVKHNYPQVRDDDN